MTKLDEDGSETVSIQEEESFGEAKDDVQLTRVMSHAYRYQISPRGGWVYDKKKAQLNTSVR